MSIAEKKISGKTVYEGKILRLEVDDVELCDGSKSKRECVRHNGGAAVLCIIDGNILLVKQFRYLYGKEIYEIPAGKLEKGENPQTAAARELEEETGYRAESISKFLKIYPTPGYTDEIIHVYFTDKCVVSAKNLDDGEFVESFLFPLDKVLSMIESGEICDSKTVAAVYKYALTVKR
ncbi:MAG: NUDIX hydrolase [Clostridia bacterium]|nr:NUDIX hydrolase [Clostridia bacterium]